MGIVKISDVMHENLRIACNALSRSMNAQAEHWLKVGMLSELYPHLTHHEITRALVKAELEGGTDITKIIQDASAMEESAQ